MKDKQLPEDDVLEDLDKIYQRVADIEKEEAAGASIQRKEEPKEKKKRSFRPLIIVGLGLCVILAGFAAFPFLKQTITSLLPKKSKTPPPLLTTPFVPKPKPPAPPPAPKEKEPLKPPSVEKPEVAPPVQTSVPKEKEPIKPPPSQKVETAPPVQVSIPKEREPVKMVPEEVKKASPVPPPGKIEKVAKAPIRKTYYTIQVGAYRDLKSARDLFEDLKDEGLDTYYTKLEGKRRGTFYKVFVGHFASEKEAARFLKEKRILEDYPGSFVRKAPSFEFHQLLGKK
ncbi:MAG: SPOR domain-containing protein [Syntrophaceae bacterium]|nr:SPOR domain-containing protein [Syntrophaceae bacterium]